MSSQRQRRVATALQAKLSELLLLDIKDPRLEGITITDIEVDREMQTADVYVNALGDEGRRDEVVSALERAAGYLRRQLAGSLDMRKIPELRFKWDTAFENASRIDELLDSLDIADTSDEGNASD